MKPKTTKSFDDLLNTSLQDPEYAKTYLQVALEEYQSDGNTEALMMALRDVAKACTTSESKT